MMTALKDAEDKSLKLDSAADRPYRRNCNRKLFKKQQLTQKKKGLNFLLVLLLISKKMDLPERIKANAEYRRAPGNSSR